MIWSLISFLSFIQLTSSTIDLTPTILGDAKQAKFSRSSHPAAERNYESTAHEYANRPQHKMHHTRPDLDQSHVTRIFESNRNGPYFRDNKNFKSKTDFWRVIDQKKKQMSEVSIMRQVEIMRVECLELRRILESQQELNLIRYPDPNRNAYRTLEAFLERLSYSLIALFYPEKPENRKIFLSHEPLQQTHWQSLVSVIHETIGELPYTLLNFEGQNNYEQMRHFVKLIPQVLRILNFLIKNSLIKEDVLQELMKQGKFKSLISDYIIKVMSYGRFLGLEFSECLLESKSTEELASVLRFFTEDELKLLEYEWLANNIDNFIQSDGLRYPKITAVLEAFSNAGFNLDDKKASSEHYEIIRAKRIRVLKQIIDYFNKSAQFGKRDLQFGFLRHQEFACGLFYDILCFVIKYHPEILEGSFEKKEEVFSFHLKWNLLDSALRYLRSAEELDFVRSEGFWTTELSFSHSRHQISIDEVHGWIPTSDGELNYFKKGFRCYVSKDFEIWRDLFKKSSLDRRMDDEKSSQCINPIHQNNERSKPFGTNFNISNVQKNQRFFNKVRSIENPMISKLFLSDLYSWIERYGFILENHKRNEKIWREILKRLRSSSPEEIIPWETRSELMHWLENSVPCTFLTHNLSEKFTTPQKTWSWIRGNMEELNTIAKARIGPGKFMKALWENIKSLKFDFKRQEALQIPNFDFQIDGFEIGEDFLLKGSKA